MEEQKQEAKLWKKWKGKIILKNHLTCKNIAI